MKRLYWGYIWRWWCDFKYGEGNWFKFYLFLAGIWNPKKPFYWYYEKKPDIKGYEFIPCTYWTGDGWIMYWGIVDEDGYFESAVDTFGGNEQDYIFRRWPFILPVCNSKSLEKMGFYIV